MLSLEAVRNQRPKKRPSTETVLELLDQALGGVSDSHHTRSNLELIQMLEKSMQDLEFLKKGVQQSGIKPLPVIFFSVQSFTPDPPVRIRRSDMKGRKKPRTTPRSLHIKHKASYTHTLLMLPILCIPLIHNLMQCMEDYNLEG